MKSVRDIPCHGTCWYFNRIAQNMRHPSPQRSCLRESWRHLDRVGWVQAKWKIFSIHTTYDALAQHLTSELWPEKRPLNHKMLMTALKSLPPNLFYHIVPRGESSLLCLLWVAFHFPKKEIKHFHSSCFCFALIKVDRKTIIEMIQNVCVCVWSTRISWLKIVNNMYW